MRIHPVTFGKTTLRDKQRTPRSLLDGIPLHYEHRLGPGQHVNKRKALAYSLDTNPSSTRADVDEATAPTSLVIVR